MMINVTSINEKPTRIIIEPIITNNTFKVRVEYNDRTKNFDKMVADRKKGEIYPIKFMDIVDENS
jgi:hypothetical protein